MVVCVCVCASISWVFTLSFFLLKAKWKVVKEQDNEVTSWMDAVEQTHSLRLTQSSLVAESCREEMVKIQNPPPGWSLEADEELARFMVQHGGKGINPSGVGNEFVRKVEASSGEVSKKMVSSIIVIAFETSKI